MMKVLITGAHLTPAVALIQALNKRVEGVEVVYVGRKHTGVAASVERAEVERLGAEFRTLVFGKLHRFLTVRQLAELVKMPVGLAAAAALILRVKPKVVVSFGGYISVPLVLAAKLFGVPVVVHEQTVVWGAANRMGRRLADAVAVSWESLNTRETVLTGNPVRQEVLLVKRDKPRRRVLYITGGNQGSKIIDRAVRPILPLLVKTYEVYHQTRGVDLFKHERYYSAEWFSSREHARILAKAGISVSRAGANTVTELAYLGIPALLIPLPLAGANEQLKNAQMLAETGLAQILTQDILSPETLMASIKLMEGLPEAAIEAAARRARKLVKADAADKLAELVEEIG